MQDDDSESAFFLGHPVEEGSCPHLHLYFGHLLTFPYSDQLYLYFSDLLAHSIPIISQRLENGREAICVRTYRLQVWIIKRASLSPQAAFFPRWLLMQRGRDAEIQKLKLEKS